MRTLAILPSIGLTLAICLAGATPAAAQSPAPPITVERVPDIDEPAAGTADETQAPAAKTAPAPAAKKKASAEVLPWADKPLVPMAAATTAGDPAAAEAAAAQCASLFEAACRDLKTCAWVADVALEDGTSVPARCVVRPPAPPKSAAKKTAAPAKTVKAPADGEVAAPAVKASVTRIEDVAPPAAPTVEKRKATTLSKPEAPPPAQAKAPDPVEETPVESGHAERTENAPETAEAQAPIVVKPPPEEPKAPQMPSFGSISPIMPGGGDAVVVTVPPSP